MPNLAQLSQLCQILAWGCSVLQEYWAHLHFSVSFLMILSYVLWIHSLADTQDVSHTNKVGQLALIIEKTTICLIFFKISLILV